MKILMKEITTRIWKGLEISYLYFYLYIAVRYVIAKSMLLHETDTFYPKLFLNLFKIPISKFITYRVRFKNL